MQAAAWAALIAFFWSADTLTKLDEAVRQGAAVDRFRLFTEQATSGVAAWVMVAFVVVWCRHFPIPGMRPLPVVVGHLVGSVVFTLGHYFGFVALRSLVFGWHGLDYMPDQWHGGNLIFEYKKDLKICLTMVAIVVAYRWVKESRTPSPGSVGESSSADDRPPESMVSPSAGRLEASKGVDDVETATLGGDLVVQTRHGDRLVAIDEIDYLEAARNYVVVHVGDDRFLVRSTLAALLDRLPRGRFIRTHRSYCVHVDKIVELRSDGSGHQAVLRSITTVPVSRSYRDAVKALIEHRGL